MTRFVLSLGFLIGCAGCCYTNETATSRTRLALLSDNERGPYGEREAVSAESVKLAGVGAAGYAKSALMAGAIAAPEIVGAISKPADNLTTSTIVKGP